MCYKEKTKRIPWLCRRSMWELEILLAKFNNNCLLNMSSDEINLYWDLLNLDDEMLYAWFFLGEVPIKKFSVLVNNIKKYAN